jgi:hypothetical protein
VFGLAAGSFVRRFPALKWASRVRKVHAKRPNGSAIVIGVSNAATILTRRLYARRKVRSEPFNSHLKALFELEDRVWLWGLENNRTMMLTAIFAYQILLTYNT